MEKGNEQIDFFTDAELQLLKNAIQEGVNSGISKSFDPKKHLDGLKKQNAGLIKQLSQ